MFIGIDNLPQSKLVNSWFGVRFCKIIVAPITVKGNGNSRLFVNKYSVTVRFTPGLNQIIKWPCLGFGTIIFRNNIIRYVFAENITCPKPIVERPMQGRKSGFESGFDSNRLGCEL